MSPHYDLPDPALEQEEDGLQQEFVRGKVSYTEKPFESKTWYSYDERGRLVWTAKQLFGFDNKLFTVDYAYAPGGQVARVDYRTENDLEHFWHRYEYDADGRLTFVNTKIDPKYYFPENEGMIVEMTHAYYEYYKHGPLKSLQPSAGVRRGPCV